MPSPFYQFKSIYINKSKAPQQPQNIVPNLYFCQYKTFKSNLQLISFYYLQFILISSLSFNIAHYINFSTILYQCYYFQIILIFIFQQIINQQNYSFKITQMITNFQLKPRKCKYHNLYEEFICMNRQCQYRALLCSDCTRQNHGTHLHDIRSTQSFIQSFKQKVKYYQSQFQKDKIIINVKEIVRAKLNQLDQTLNEIFIQIVKMLEKQKDIIKQKLKSIEQKYEQMENQYKKNLQSRYDCLEYLSSYKNSPKALQARIISSSQWGIVSLKNVLSDIKNLSSNQGRDVNTITETIVQQTQKILKEDSFLFSLKRFVGDFEILPGIFQNRNERITSFIQKSFITNNTIANTPKSSRVIMQRPRTHSLSNLNIPKVISNQKIQSSRQPSLERIPIKIASQTNLENNRYLKGLKRLNLSKVIIK